MLLVGEAPGAVEDQHGAAFLGRAGALLDAHIERVGLLSSCDIRITNVVRCRPPQNRTPSAAEMNACLPHLKQEILDYRPDVILLLGATAMKALLGPTAKLTEAMGAEYEVLGIPTLVTYHPAYILRTPSAEDRLITALRQCQRVAEGQGLDTLLNEVGFVTEPVVLLHGALDVETGQVGDAAHKLLSVAVFNEDIPAPIVAPILHSSGEGVVSFAAPQHTQPQLIGHNFAFDMRALEEQFGEDLPALEQYWAWDTMLFQHLKDETSPKGLKYLAQRELGARAYAIDTKSLTEDSDWDELARYNALDARYTWELALKQQAEATPTQRRLMQDLVMPAARSLYAMEINGIHLDQPYTTQLIKDTSAQVDHLIAEQLPPCDSWSPSSKAFRDYMSAHYPVIATSPKTGAPSWDKEVLFMLGMLNPDDDVIHHILELRQHQKLIGYLTSWLKATEGYAASRIHPHYKVTGTRTGRISAVEPNIQQVPRDPKVRRCFVPEDGNLFISADFSQLELRVAAALADEPTLLAAYRNGEDVHRGMAAELTGQSYELVTKEQRAKAKTVNFGFLYGMQAEKFRELCRKNYGFDPTPKAAQFARRKFFERYPRLEAWHQEVRSTVEREGEVVSLTGRTRRLPEAWATDRRLVEEAYRQGINFGVQSLASDLMMLALPRIEEAISQMSSTGGLVTTVHDSVLVEVPEAGASYAADAVREIMETCHWPELQTGLYDKVPLVADIEIKETW